jgi:twinkle protein
MTDYSEHLIGPAGLLPELLGLHERGLPPGDKTGWPSLDRHYTVGEGQWTCITGWPGSGKSEWLDALLVNLSHQGWHTALYSPENQPPEIHAAKLLEKVTGKPFGRGPTERMSEQEVKQTAVNIASKFMFVRVPEEGGLSAQKVIDAACLWLDKFIGKKRALVIDPWNELEHWRPKGLSETEYISQQLSLVRNWARASKVHVFIVAHPQKVPRENGKLPIPRPDMIAGSQHWWNKADNAICVWRPLDDPDSQIVDIHVQKIRFKHMGRTGVVSLRYDRVTGRYHETPNLQDVSAYRRMSNGDED